MGLAAGQRVRRAVEIVLGVVLGLLAADLFVYIAGNGPLQLTGAVLLASGTAVALVGARNLLSNQAAIAAVLVVALMPVSPNPFGPFGRLLEALIGGGVALALTMIFARDPLVAVRRAASHVTEGMRTTVSMIIESLEEGDLSKAEAALEHSSEVARRTHDFDAAVSAARETARLARHHRTRLKSLPPFTTARARLDILVSTLRGLSRAAANAVRYGHDPAPELVAALEHLEESISDLDRVLHGEASPETAQNQALLAATASSEVLTRDHHLTASVMVGQIRSAVVDVLRATGASQEDAIRLLEDAAGRADRAA